MSQLIELLDLIARWIHVIAGIMWVGNSMLFNWLDRNLVPRSGDRLSYGDIWLLHSGAFYDVEKNRGRRKPSREPQVERRELHWFKWQAYTTWISGAALLVVVYYAGGRAVLTDPGVTDIGHRAAAVAAIGVIVVAWAAYEVIWRTLGRRAPKVAAVLSVVALTQVVEVYLLFLNGRAAWVHVGALLGTIMAGNVAMTIMPSQRELVSALEEGRPPSQAIADRAKTRSIHNNYITFPVIALMLSAHFPSLYASFNSDLALFTIVAGGAAVRYVLNARFTFARWKPALAGVVAGTVLLLATLVGAVKLPGVQDPAVQDPVVQTPEFSEVRRIIDRRCASCHSAEPADVSLGPTPAGIAFDTPDQIRALLPRIQERAIATRTMPPANKTRMTETERAMLARWIAVQDPR